MKAVEILKAELGTQRENLEVLRKKCAVCEKEISELERGLLILNTQEVHVQKPDTETIQLEAKNKRPDLGRPVHTMLMFNANKKVVIYSNIVREIAEAIRPIPPGTWFKISAIKPVISKYYASSSNMMTAYMRYLVTVLKTIEHNGKKASGCAYRVIPKVEPTQDQVRQKVEDERRLHNDVMG